ncbi:MAG: hypothetical protein LBQ76_00865 [Candidatus Fibromonas sp.]|jgi:NTE family protein|nr:hypothetical protein [Candidatus Fibromonas sp.]
MPKFLALFAIISFCANAFAQKSTVLYMGGDYPSIQYHLGVLSEIERLQIPIDTVVGSDWGAFAGALWSAGWSSGQIRELVKSWDSLPQAKQLLKPALWEKRWLIKSKENGDPIFESIKNSKPCFGQIFFDLRVQEAIWRSEIGSKIPFREINKEDNYPFPEQSGLPSAIILSTPLALRDTNGPAAQRYQQKLWSRDSALLILRPHSKPNPDSLFEIGVQTAQSHRSQLATLYPQPPTLNSQLYKESPLPPPRFLYHPVFDSVPAEIQGHLESLWNPSDTGLPAVRNFLEALQKDGSYPEVKLTLDTGSFLQINTESIPLLSLSLAGFGGTLFGANVAGNINFRFVNQFGYNWDLTAFYGQGARGAELNLRFERFFMRDGDFFINPKIFEYEPISYFQKSIYQDARLLKERGSGAAIGIEKQRLQVAVEIERRRITSGAAGYTVYEYDIENEELVPVDVIYEFVTVVSMFPYAKWLWQSEDYNRWFSSDGFMAELMGGFKGVSINTFGQNAPLYVSTQGKLGIAHPLSKYISVSAGSEFGFNFRRRDNGKIVLPGELYGYSHYYGDNLYDPALENRHRFAMGMGSFQEGWQTPDNASHRYGLAFAGLSLHWQESGIFLTGGFAKDGEQNPWSELKAARFFAEPKIRIKTQVFDFILGQNMVYSGKNRIFLTVQGANF